MTQEELTRVMTSVIESYDRGDATKIVEGIDQIVAYIEETPWPESLMSGVNEVVKSLKLLCHYAKTGRVLGVDKGIFDSTLDTFVFGVLVPWLSSLKSTKTFTNMNRGGSA